MAKKLALVDGLPRMVNEAGSTTIYDQPLTIVASGAGANEMNGPVNAGVSVTLPSSGEYNSTELQIFLNGTRLEAVFDYNYVGSIMRTQVQFTFGLVVGDVLVFRIDRAF
jgi:hypothetical protein